VHVDGKPVRSCLLAVGAIGDRAIVQSMNDDLLRMIGSFFGHFTTLNIKGTSSGPGASRGRKLKSHNAICTPRAKLYDFHP
jgi:hypothetical protein